ncbi:MAG TPA: TIGR03545 family protein [Gammaproteobacteria bacterium]
MKFIRWPGFIAFFVLVAVIVGGTLLFAETITKSIFESSLSRINGAKVDISNVEIGYSPLSIELQNIQVADKQQPMVNTVQIGVAKFRLSFGDLLLKKVIIDEMSLNNIEVETPRKSSGALVKKKDKVEDKSDSMFAFDMPDIGLPEINKVLQVEPFKTDKLIETLNADFDATKQSWQTIHDDLMNKARWEGYESRYVKIKEEFKGSSEQKRDAIEDAKALKKDLKLEFEKVRNAKDQFNTDSERLEAEFKAAKDGPKNDIKAIKDKYKVENLNASNITQLLFGEQAAQYVSTAQKWHQRIKPYLGDDKPEPVKRSEGVNVAYKEFNPKPGFYIAKAALNVNTVRGRFEGNITDISSDQSMSKKPTRFLLAGKEMRNRDSEKLSGEVNYIQKDKGFVDINYDIQANKISDFAVSKSSKLAITMDNGLMDMRLGARFQSGQVKGSANVDFNNVMFKTNKNESGQSLSSMLAASLAEVRRFNINAVFSGSFKDMDMSIKSDLDNQLGMQLKARFKERITQFENELRAKIEAKYQEPLQKIEAKRQQLQEIKTKIDNKEKELRQKLDDLENKIDQEKDLKEQELKSKIDDKKDKLLDKLKSKLGR